VVSITLCNLNPEKTESIDLTLTGQEFASASGQVITSPNMNDYNDFGQKREGNHKSLRCEETEKR
jgi:alpha-L-arabinofuranosidase